MKLLDTILENIELDEWVIKTDQERIEEFKKKFPNYDYSDAKIYKDGKALKIKNIKCKIHNHNFPEEGRPEGIELKKHLDGIGCRDCGKESLSKKASERFKKTDKQWREVLSKFKNLKDKCDFSKSKISFIEPMTYGPLVSNIYCKIHKKFFNGGPNNEGFRTNSLYKKIILNIVLNILRIGL
jgi:hypothetical protein